jgi:hypothetical protein
MADPGTWRAPPDQWVKESSTTYDPPEQESIGKVFDAWPTLYRVDANGVIRDGGPRVGRPRSVLDSVLDKAVEDMVADAEAKKP